MTLEIVGDFGIGKDGRDDLPRFYHLDGPIYVRDDMDVDAIESGLTFPIPIECRQTDDFIGDKFLESKRSATDGTIAYFLKSLYN